MKCDLAFAEHGTSNDEHDRMYLQTRTHVEVFCGQDTPLVMESMLITLITRCIDAWSRQKEDRKQYFGLDGSAEAAHSIVAVAAACRCANCGASRFLSERPLAGRTGGQTDSRSGDGQICSPTDEEPID